MSFLAFLSGCFFDQKQLFVNANDKLQQSKISFYINYLSRFRGHEQLTARSLLRRFAVLSDTSTSVFVPRLSIKSLMCALHNEMCVVHKAMTRWAVLNSIVSSNFDLMTSKWRSSNVPRLCNSVQTVEPGAGSHQVTQARSVRVETYWCIWGWLAG